MIQVIKPWLRALKYDFLQHYSENKAKNEKIYTKTIDAPTFAFLIGCGRSGTTLLGQLFLRHNKVIYFFEPYHLWAAIDPLTDVLNLYHQGDACFLMNTSLVTEEKIVRFNRLFLSLRMNANTKVLIEKTPLNAMRIGYLNSLNPQAKFIHIVRDGIDVSSSIDRIASTNSYKIAGKLKLNQWWGVENYKWKALSRDGISAGYYPDEVSLLENNRAKGAYEWLVTLGEVDRWREQLGDRLYEITYNQLTTNPEDTLRNICEFLYLDSSSAWLNQATKMIRPFRHSLGEILCLPPRMCNAFNRYQERFGFANRAISS